MAAYSTRPARKSFLTLSPVDFSLTAGTSIPAPPDSPPRSPAIARPPTPGRGPLSSHPTTPEDLEVAVGLPGAFPPTPEPEKEIIAKMSTSTAASTKQRERQDSFQTPGSPASAMQPPKTASYSPPAQRRPSGVRRLLSLNSLRSSFSSSRTSLAMPRESTESQPQQVNNLKRPSSPSMSFSTTASTTHQPQQTLHKKKSGSGWFRRKSGMFMLNEDHPETLAAVDENQRPDTRDSKRSRLHSPAPLLPEVSSLACGSLTGGEVGWDEQLFKR